MNRKKKVYLILEYVFVFTFNYKRHIIFQIFVHEIAKIKKLKTRNENKKNIFSNQTDIKLL
jgi:hypothetical protein